MPERCPVCDTPIVRDEGAVRHYCPNLGLPGPGRRRSSATSSGGRDGHRGRRLEGPRAAPPDRARQAPRRLLPADASRTSRASSGSPGRAPRTSTPRSRSRAAGRSSGSSPRSGSRRSAGRPRSSWRRGSPPRSPAGDGWLVRARGDHLETRSRPSEPERFDEVEGVGPTVSAALAAWFGAGGPGEGVLEDLADAGVEAELPGAAPAGGGDGGDGPLAGKTVVVTGHDRGLQPRGGRGRPSATPAASRPARCRRRPTTSSPARAPARSWRRPRSSACRSSTPTAFARLLAGETPEEP